MKTSIRGARTAKWILELFSSPPHWRPAVSLKRVVELALSMPPNTCSPTSISHHRLCTSCNDPSGFKPSGLNTGLLSA